MEILVPIYACWVIVFNLTGYRSFMMVGHVDTVKEESMIVVAPGGRVVACATDVGVMALKERSSGASIPDICFLGDCF